MKHSDTLRPIYKQTMLKGCALILALTAIVSASISLCWHAWSSGSTFAPVVYSAGGAASLVLLVIVSVACLDMRKAMRNLEQAEEELETSELELLKSTVKIECLKAWDQCRKARDTYKKEAE